MLILSFSLSVITTFAIMIGAAAPEDTLAAAQRRAGPADPAPRERQSIAKVEITLDVAFSPETFGRSGALRVIQTMPGERLASSLLRWTGSRPEDVRYRWVPVLRTDSDLLGSAQLKKRDSLVAPSNPGVYELRLEAGGSTRHLDRVRLIVQIPFDHKKNGYLAGYHIGRYPTEGSGRTDAYAPPRGFIRVTRENQDLRLSEHFRLSEFLTHDQDGAWPKVAVVDLQLLDKLELVMDELVSRGIRADDMVVMSGFRTPQYNSRGLGAGRARLSRHQFGDAADVWIDSDGDWYMDDLNADGRINTADARVMLRAVESVVSRYPDLVGGAGIYDDNGVHGPFIHIDARGYSARW